MSGTHTSFLALEDRHVFLTGGAGGVGSAAAKEFLGKHFTSRENIVRSSNAMHKPMDAL